MKLNHLATLAANWQYHLLVEETDVDTVLCSFIFLLDQFQKRTEIMSESDLQDALSIFARFPTPPCAATLGWELLDANFEAGTVQIGFLAKSDFCNPSGYVQGGFLAAMLDDTMGPAVVVKSRGSMFTPTINLNVTFIAPAKTGKLVGNGKIIQQGKSICSLEGELFDESQNLVARATASSRLVSMAKAVGR
ncbi:PaaI family thioesterase [Parasphingorhabdus cellanae]|uniref:PaaI family thioesterase n=1 Tax=Parasphingorhabdus cellanae TaxID=2806553 RepID=A0ABX7T9S2_9SPHN|nr:PaaI family thioesterase [Parasphingorhabdus cellanae]QTD57314.1 PaaI family thioesterase [Parasphingorhabdus cellanae]